MISSRRMPEVIMGTVSLLACVLIASVYSGGLASTMTVPQCVFIGRMEFSKYAIRLWPVCGKDR